jgi:hypothetical protein
MQKEGAAGTRQAANHPTQAETVAAAAAGEQGAAEQQLGAWVQGRPVTASVTLALYGPLSARLHHQITAAEREKRRQRTQGEGTERHEGKGQNGADEGCVVSAVQRTRVVQIGQRRLWGNRMGCPLRIGQHSGRHPTNALCQAGTDRRCANRTSTRLLASLCRIVCRLLLPPSRVRARKAGQLASQSREGCSHQARGIVDAATGHNGIG